MEKINTINLIANHRLFHDCDNYDFYTSTSQFIWLAAIVYISYRIIKWYRRAAREAEINEEIERRADVSKEFISKEEANFHHRVNKKRQLNRIYHQIEHDPSPDWKEYERRIAEIIRK